MPWSLIEARRRRRGRRAVLPGRRGEGTNRPRASGAPAGRLGKVGNVEGDAGSSSGTGTGACGRCARGDAGTGGGGSGADTWSGSSASRSLRGQAMTGCGARRRLQRGPGRRPREGPTHRPASRRTSPSATSVRSASSSLESNRRSSRKWRASRRRLAGACRASACPTASGARGAGDPTQPSSTLLPSTAASSSASDVHALREELVRPRRQRAHALGPRLEEALDVAVDVARALEDAVGAELDTARPRTPPRAP